jgi:hypothetical protein
MRLTKSALSNRSASLATLLALLVVMANSAAGMSIEESNGCAATEDDPCLRTGTCEIQGATWTQTVTIDRSDIFDTQGWAGVCDMVHVALVQGDCEPSGAKTNVVASLSETSFATIPEIVGPLSCAGEPEPPAVPALGIVGSVLLATALAAFGCVAVRRA